MLWWSLAFAGPPKPEQVGEVLAVRATEQLSSACRLDDSAGGVRCENGAFLSLERFGPAYAEANRRTRKRLIADWSSSLDDPRTVFQHSLARLHPHVQSRSEAHILALRVAALKTGAAASTQAITPTVSVTLALGGEDLQFPADADLVRWGLQPTEALALGISNLEQRLVVPEELAPGLFMFATQDGSASAQALWGAARKDLGLAGAPVALLVGRDLAFLIGDADPAGVGALLDVSLRSFADPAQGERISLVPLRLGEGGWSDLELPAGHPAEQALQGLSRLQTGLWIRDQRLAFEGVGRVDVAPLGAQPRADGSVAYLVELTADKPVVPQADWVVLREGEQVRFVTWPAFREAAGTFVKDEPNTYPTLYRTDAQALLADPERFARLWLGAEELFGP